MEPYLIKYLAFYKKLVPEFTKDELDFIGNKVSILNLDKNKYYLRQNEVQKKIGFVCAGLTRIYYINDLGNEITVSFSPEHTFTTDYASFLKQQPSKYNIKTLEPSILIELDFKLMQDGFTRYKNYERFGRLITEKILIERQKKLESFLFNTAEQRYLNFIKEHPSLFNRISLTHLSSYLGIERQSLSRIRKKLSK